MIKAIETSYAGYRFRSRTEARWAVFFDKAGMEWTYEPEGFETSAGRYLPDFYLENLGLWLEVKPRVELISEYDWKRIDAFGIHKRIVVLVGEPWPGKYAFWDLDHNKGQTKSKELWAQCPLCGRIQPLAPWYAGQDDHAYCAACDVWARDSGPIDGFTPNEAVGFHKGDVTAPPGWDWESCEVRLAFLAARRARFEHGETP